MSSQLKFHFDFISPYSYLAWQEIYKLAKRHGREVEPVPVVLGALLNAFDNKAPGEVEAKRLYVMQDVWRLARRLKIPVNIPPTHPFNPIFVLRIASHPHAPDRARLITTLFDAIWRDSLDVTDPKIVSELLTSEGWDARTLLAAAESPEAKAILRKNTDAAIAAGIFGVPTIQVDEEIFWGLDSFANLDAYLESPHHVDRVLFEKWKNIKSSSSRQPDWKKFCDSWLPAWTGNQPAKLIEFYSPQAFYRDPGRVSGLRGHGEILPYFKKLLQANPDWEWSAEDIFPIKNGFTLRWKAKIPVNGKIIIETGLDIVQVEGGKITRNEVYFDRTSLLH